MFPADPVELARSLIDAARASRQRRVLVLGGEPAWARAAGEGLRGALQTTALWVGDTAPAGWTACAPRAARGQLGREYQLVCLDAFAGLDPDALGAVAGTLVGGGLLCLLCPPLATWQVYADPECERMCVAPGSVEAVGGRFLHRLATMLADAPGVCIVHQDGRVSGDPSALELPAELATEPAISADGCVNDEQRVAVAAVLNVVRGHRRRPAVLTAHRGRGKSAALGLAAAVLMAERGATVLLTGPSLAAVEAVFEHAAARLSGVRRSRTELVCGAGRLRFVAPDALAVSPPVADLVLVDEAAALPQSLLLRLLRACPRLAFATTVHGYEGSGRAFALRFESRLDAEAPGWRALTLKSPVRWAEHDPLEALGFRALLLDAEPAPAASIAGVPMLRATIERLDRDALAADEALLREVFGLLVLAHYRTRPFDLRQMLDGPSVAVWVARLNGCVAAVALIAEEGGLPPDLACEVASGRRRVRGHLLPQVLAAHCGRPDAMALRGWRVLRLAVHPAVRRRGLGLALLARLSTDARACGQDWLGASFGATPTLLAFWRHAGLMPLRVGATREASSGAHAALVLRPLSVEAESLYRALRRRYLALSPQLLGDALRDIDPLLALALLARDPDDGVPSVPSPEWRRDAEDFARGARDYEDALGVLWHLAVEVLPRTAFTGDTAYRARQALAMKVLQKRSWKTTAEHLGVPGRRQVMALLREATARLI
ncbi:hypothetical protein BI364_01990 [Acidihalobacter yilgarnensis]|uniref:tRNA(Met) cytidine acetyltransferase TmcA n=2 Tax=Acidihalobacter yilgarnensis TaxID=2819280 RepID=A0A1D8IKM9_9GAMM|nr:hypothetical protein BI364_01990 [Acidihalobacter yilgarnensis]